MFAGESKGGDQQGGSPRHRREWEEDGEEEEEDDGEEGADGTEASASISLMDEVFFPFALGFSRVFQDSLEKGSLF